MTEFLAVVFVAAVFVVGYVAGLARGRQLEALDRARDAEARHLAAVRARLRGTE